MRDGQTGSRAAVFQTATECLGNRGRFTVLDLELVALIRFEDYLDDRVLRACEQECLLICNQSFPLFCRVVLVRVCGQYLVKVIQSPS